MSRKHSKKSKPVFIEREPKIIDKPSKKKPAKKPDFAVLEEIYEPDGESQDLSKIEPVKRKPQTIIIGLLIFFAILAAVSWAGFFIFKPYGRFEGDGVALKIQGPDFPKAGEMATYDFEYKNTERVALAALEMRLVVPEEFYVLEAIPVPTTEPYTWTLGSLASNRQDKIALRGFFLGPGEGSTAFQNIATYRPSNFNADFQAITTKPILMSGTVLEGETTGPSEAAPGEEIEYTYILKHGGEEALENLTLKLEAPEHFLFNESEPEPSESGFEVLWEIPRLEPEEEREFVINGRFAGDTTGQTEVGLSIGIQHGDERLVHRTDTVEVEVLKSDLGLDLVINGSTKNRSAEFGDALLLSLSYENTGAREVGDVRLSLIATESPRGLLDWSSAKISEKGRRKENGYTWTSTELSALKNLDAGAGGVIDIAVPIVPSSASTGADEIRFAATALLSSVGGRTLERQLQTTPIIITLNTDLRASGQARYFDNDGVPLGTGALPPKVGEQTNLRIFWQINNSRHDLENLEMRTVLPENVSWTGRSRTDAGVLSWNAGSRTVTLVVDHLPLDMTRLSADFEVRIIPEAGDAGGFMALTNETRLEARDTKTNTTLSRLISALTTDMQFDSFASGKGAVVE